MYKEGGKQLGSSSFWRENSRPLPGSVKPVHSQQELSTKDIERNSSTSLQSPIKMPSTPKKQTKGSATASFQRFEENTLDAWSDGDDELLSRLRLDSSMIQSAANQVIKNHSEQPADNTHKSGQVTKADKAADAKGDKSKTAMPAKTESNKGAIVNRSKSIGETEREKAKAAKFEALINGPKNNLLEDLRQLSWSGIPSACRPIAWKILCGYLPAATDRRKMTLDRKRQEYFGFLSQYFDTRHQDQHQDTFRQIHIDVPRMNPLIPLFQNKQVQEIFERILYIWAIRHPASGYVQGINDLVTPFFVVFLTEYLDADVECDHIDIGVLSKEQLDMIEADSYWCMSKLLDGIQDNYTFAQPGIQRKVAALKDLTQRIDAQLHNHIEAQGIEFLQFAFRWMNNLLMRELPLRCTVRLWDTYLAEPEGFAHFHLYVCVAFLTKFSKKLLLETDFQGVMMLLQNLPTQSWQDSDIGELTAEAYRLKYTFADAPQHLKTQT